MEVRIALSPAQYNYIARTADAALDAIDKSPNLGVSQIRGDYDRAMKKREDQIVGRCAEAALHLYWYGHLIIYAKGRWGQDRHAEQGDGGSDIWGANIDVKGSLLRSDRMPHGNYHLCVRPREMHEDWVYILALVDLPWSGPNIPATVYLMGWASSDEFDGPDEDGPFRGAHVIKASSLHPLPPVRHLWN